MNILSPLLLWVLGLLIVGILVGAGIALWRQQRNQARRTEVARWYGIALPSSIVLAPLKEQNPVGSVEYRLPHYLSDDPQSSESTTVIPAISTLIYDRWMFSSIYPTHISDLAWQLRSRRHTIPLSPEEKAKAQHSGDDIVANNCDGRCELADFAAMLPADLAARIDPDNDVLYL